MHVKNYEEAVEAIDDIVFKAKIPIITMVAILEVKKHQLLLEHHISARTKEAREFFKALQKKTETNAAKMGVT